MSDDALGRAMIGGASIALVSVADQFARSPKATYSGAEVARMLREMDARLSHGLREEWDLAPEVEEDRPE